MPADTATSLTVSRVFKTTPEKLWDIWTDPKKVEQWHRPNTDEYTTEASVDLRVGGSYSIRMKMSDTTFEVGGVFTQLDPPHTMTYTWDWKDGSEHSEVHVELEAVPEGTKLTLTHTKLSGPESVAAHRAGWEGCLNNIEALG